MVGGWVGGGRTEGASGGFGGVWRVGGEVEEGEGPAQVDRRLLISSDLLPTTQEWQRFLLAQTVATCATTSTDSLEPPSFAALRAGTPSTAYYSPPLLFSRRALILPQSTSCQKVQ